MTQPASAVTPSTDHSLRLTLVASECGYNTCPAVFTVDSDADALIVQGYQVSAADAGIDVPDGERLVRIPAAVLREALKQLS